MRYLSSSPTFAFKHNGSAFLTRGFQAWKRPQSGHKQHQEELSKDACPDPAEARPAKDGAAQTRLATDESKIKSQSNPSSPPLNDLMKQTEPKQPFSSLSEMLTSVQEQVRSSSSESASGVKGQVWSPPQIQTVVSDHLKHLKHYNLTRKQYRDGRRSSPWETALKRFEEEKGLEKERQRQLDKKMNENVGRGAQSPKGFEMPSKPRASRDTQSMTKGNRSVDDHELLECKNPSQSRANQDSEALSSESQLSSPAIEDPFVRPRTSRPVTEWSSNNKHRNYLINLLKSQIRAGQTTLMSRSKLWTETVKVSILRLQYKLTTPLGIWSLLRSAGRFCFKLLDWFLALAIWYLFVLSTFACGILNLSAFTDTLWIAHFAMSRLVR